jgi:hypothetical protein
VHFRCRTLKSKRCANRTIERNVSGIRQALSLGEMNCVRVCKECEPGSPAVVIQRSQSFMEVPARRSVGL